MILFNKKISSYSRIKNLFFLNRLERCLIFNEYSAQIEKVRRNEISITHIDTHHQIHDMLSISKIILELLKKYKIPSMRILNNLEKSNNYYKNAYRFSLNHYLKVRKANFSDFLGNRLTVLSILERNPDFFKNENKILEIIVHPNLDDNGLLIDKIGGKEYDFRFQKIFEAI